MITGTLGLLSQILVISLVFFLGRFNFSVGWLLLAIFSSYHNTTRRIHEVRRAITHATSSMLERDVILTRLQDIPAWVIFPDVERAEWANSILKIFWPQVNGLVEMKLHKIESKVNKIFGLESFKFKKIDFGKIAPRITGIKVHDKNTLQDEIVIDLNFSYFGDSELTVVLNGIDGGIKNIELEGKARVGLKHLMSELPLMHGIEIGFLDSPKFDFQLTTALSTLDMFATGNLLRSIIKGQISRRLVYPNKIYIKLKKFVEPNLIPKVDGIIRVMIDSVENLEMFDGQKAKTIVKLGMQSDSQELLIKDGKINLNFECDFADFTDAEKSLEIFVSVKHDDESSTSLQGKIDFLSLSDDKKIKGTFQLNPSGSVAASLSWLALSSDRKDFLNNLNKLSALLQVFIDSPDQLAEDKKNVFVKVSIADQEQKTSTLNEDSKSWKENFLFFIQNPENYEILIELYDDNSIENFATFNYKISELISRKNMQQELQSFPFVCFKICEISMSFKLQAIINS